MIVIRDAISWVLIEKKEKKRTTNETYHKDTRVSGNETGLLTAFMETRSV